MPMLSDIFEKSLILSAGHLVLVYPECFELNFAHRPLIVVSSFAAENINAALYLNHVFFMRVGYFGHFGLSGGFRAEPFKA
ncbi:MAG TPA: hypothetical protein DCG57_07800 [Candidatus Riflebacteria bacterium]|nr:hypothetical protein [Candidatus Riflebacteria bacterium]